MGVATSGRVWVRLHTGGRLDGRRYRMGTGSPCPSGIGAGARLMVGTGAAAAPLLAARAALPLYFGHKKTHPYSVLTVGVRGSLAHAGEAEPT